jgi:hypothetical protein
MEAAAIVRFQKAWEKVKALSSLAQKKPMSVLEIKAAVPIYQTTQRGVRWNAETRNSRRIDYGSDAL